VSLYLEQIAKALSRQKGRDLSAWVADARRRLPLDLTSAEQLSRRRRFLEDSLGDPEEAKVVFERIIRGNELQDANYLARGARAARSVARVAIIDDSGAPIGWGTGFLIAPGVLITNNHVLPSPSMAAHSLAQFRYERDINGTLQPPIPFRLTPGALFHTSAARDFTVVAVHDQSEDKAAALADFGFLPLVAATGKVIEGEWLTIVQHPGGERKQVCVRDNQLVKIDDDVLWYSTDTLGGSSGSPVHNSDWYVVALHHAGVPETREGKVQTIDGRDFDPARDSEQSIKWIANEGVRVSRIVEELRAHLPHHPLLRPVFESTPASARVVVPQAVISGLSLGFRSAPLPPHDQENPMSDTLDPFGERQVTVTLGIGPSGAVRIVNGGEEAERTSERGGSSKPPPFDVPFDADYADRAGYDPAFLGKDHAVQLPKLGAAAETDAAPLLKPANGNKHVLKYHNYSLVMHEKRRLAMYSAANVDFSGRFDMSRPADVWRMDPRIRADAQISNFYYRDNKFDRGHLTRREDLEYGRSRKDALVSAADTCHYTNCTPQHARFNQSKKLWQGIERHVLEGAIERDQFRAQVLTGPILAEDDPTWDRYPDIQYPVRFWKVVAAVNSKGKLFATAYILDQTAVIDQHGIEAAREVPFGPYKTFQVPISEVERETGMTFWSGPADRPVSLSKADPLAGGVVPRRPGRSRAHEAAGVEAPLGYHFISALENIYLGER
jgi:endonuclease G, mitochondrial